MGFHQDIEQKIITLDEMCKRLDTLRSRETKCNVVFTNGCFDLLHRGHADYLSRARDLGDLLIVGLNSDSSVSRLKGPSRPISNQNSRAYLLASFAFVDYVILFEDDTPKKLIEAIRPDILVKGGDYKKEEVVGWDFVESYGGKVALLDLVRGESTTNLVNRMNR
ncbi:MAG: D-glycero-beta-D-manno-heptose 1-phosphate adenylyltransferase [Bacteroidales bacterium]|nr:D-glycero-beta-D-manno-heptose 1-phosphate adenylyltransferase [Bacteroidales bacterium]